MKKIICFFIGHKIKSPKPGRYFIYCQRCKKDMFLEVMDIFAKAKK